jgi:hypothetical protein
MSNHRSLIESVARERHAERYRRAPGQRVAAPTETLRHRRSRAGWLLVAIGLRLALPRGSERARTTTLLGR